MAERRASRHGFGERRTRAWAIGGLVMIVSASAFHANRVNEEPAPPELSAAVPAEPPSESAPSGIPLPIAAESPAMPGAPGPPGDPPVVQRFLELTRHPPSSRPLGPDSTDLLHPGKRYEGRQPLSPRDSGDKWEVFYTADRFAVRGEESVVISLALWHDGEPVLPTGVRLTGERLGPRVSPRPVRIPAVREGREYRAEFTPEDYWPDHLGRIQVKATFDAPDLSPQTGTLAFYFTPSSQLPGHFTGKIGDRLANGDLVVDVGLEIRTPGTFRVEGNLYDRHDRPVAWARYQGALDEGQQSVALTYHGLIFHEVAASPPFVLRQLRGHRMRPGDSPDREDLPSRSGEWKIHDRYVLSDFRRTEHQSDRKQKMVEMYRDAAARGVRFTKQ